MPASYPTSAKSFTTKADGPGNTILAAHVNDLQLEVTAVEQDLITGLPVGRGGTGALTHTSGSVLVGAGAAAITSTLTPSLNAVVFPATQVASANANTLDDYEEGTWTPTIGGSGGQSGQTYTAQVGRYEKIGKKVWCSFYIKLSALGTITTNVQIQGLPFTVENTTNQFAPVQIGYWANMTSSFVLIAGYADPNTTAGTLYGATAAATGLTALAQANLSATTELIGCITFMATA